MAIIRQTFKNHWLHNRKNDWTDFQEVWSMDPIHDWGKCHNHESPPQTDLMWGLELLYGDLACDLGHRFLKRGLNYIKRVESEIQLDQPPYNSGFPHNRAQLMETKGLLIGLLENRTDDISFRQSAQDYQDKINAPGQSKSWTDDDFIQALFVTAVRLELIRGAVDEAKVLIDSTSNTQWLHPEYWLWRDLVVQWETAGRISPSLTDTLWEHFDFIRNPEYRPEMYIPMDELRPETAAIIYKYVLADGGNIDWQKAVQMVAQ